MRSIIFISAVFGAVVAQAGEGPPTGCYQRDYSAAHLAANPAQIVDDIRLKIYVQPEFGEVVGDLRVRFADQGRLRGSAYAGQVLEQFLICWKDSTRSGCSVECDGGSFMVTRQTPTAMTIQTDYLLVGDTEGCGGAVDLAEVLGQPVKYRLDVRADDVCDEF